jgi:hypothetical protein
MGTEQSKPTGPDLAVGIPVDDVPDGQMLAGHVGDDAVLLARHGAEFFAISANCSHYGGPLAEGLMGSRVARRQALRDNQKGGADAAHEERRRARDRNA